MEYPGSRLTKSWRTAILWLFIALFFVLSPAIILYTSGYRFDVTVSSLKEVGTLALDGLPRESTVFLNGTIKSNHIPVDFKTISPGTYRLTITSTGHHTWETTINVKAKESTYLKNIDLPRQTIPEQRVSVVPTAWTALSKNPGLIYALPTSQGTALIFQALDNPRFRLITTTAERVIDLTHSPSERFTIAKTSSSRYLFIKNADFSIALSTSSFSTVAWDADGDDSLVYANQGTTTLYYDFSKNITHPLVTSTIQWVPYKNQIWQLTAGTLSSSTLAIISAHTDIFSQTEEQWNADMNSWPHGPAWILTSITRDTAILKHASGGQQAFVGRKGMFITRTENHSENSLHSKIIAWGPLEVWTIEKQSTPILRYRSSAPLTCADTLNKTDLLLLCTDRKMIAYQSVSGASFELITSSTIRRAHALPTARTILFEGIYNGIDGIWSLTY